MGRLMKHNIDKDELIDMYQDGVSGIKIAEHFGIKTYQVHYILDKHGIKKRKNGDNLKLYTANYRYFQSIDSEEKAYWLGFIAADGFITTSNNNFGVSLAKKRPWPY